MRKEQGIGLAGGRDCNRLRERPPMQTMVQGCSRTAIDARAHQPRTVKKRDRSMGSEDDLSVSLMINTRFGSSGTATAASVSPALATTIGFGGKTHNRSGNAR